MIETADVELTALDEILTPEKLLSVNHALELLEKLDKLGIIDVVNGVLDDEEYLGKIMGAIVNDKTLTLINNFDKLTGLLDFLMDAETMDNVKYALSLVGKLKGTGIIDPIIGILQDEEYMSKIMGAIVNDKVLELIGQWNNIVDLITDLTDAETLSAIKSTVGLLKDLNKSGIIDPIKGILHDEEYMGKIMGALVNDFTLNLISSWNQITSDLSKIDMTNFKYYIQLINSIGEGLKEGKMMDTINIVKDIAKEQSTVNLLTAVGNALKSEKVKPIGLGGLLSSLRDPEVQKGLGVVIEILKNIGSYYKS
ncbi:DUF1641 domain-containing protein [Acidianus sp. HS-5]|uniref:DUF1641 domain-containing protein n=1 Tax=Acidianus sp. HS-5 TaxID=2886040 RepID=UPI001F1799C0|nr:DUF1641 domain-containing protein [Acidianus sp. HS-5]BDC18989.1 hypothetical protein HS5_18790 [Acidianus sp. HS-5]